LKIARLLLSIMLVFALFCSGRGALLLYSLQSMEGVNAFSPASAEEVSRIAAPFQTNTPETNGLFRIIQSQHSDLGLMFSYLESSVWLNRNLAVAGTAASAILSLALALALIAIPSRVRPTP
jgi:hypothetical protein